MEKPKKKFQAGAIQATVFVNTRKVDGKNVEIPTVSFQKRYLEDGEWKSTSSLGMGDLPKAVMVLWKAYDYLLGLKTSGMPDEGSNAVQELSSN